mgnify:CR=1 FL=1
MKDLEDRAQKREEHIKRLEEQEAHWNARDLQRRYREHPHHRIRVVPKK